MCSSPRLLQQPSPRMRVGYLSSDFTKHVMTQLLWNLYPMHDRQRVTVFCYSLSRDDRTVPWLVATAAWRTAPGERGPLTQPVCAWFAGVLETTQRRHVQAHCDEYHDVHALDDAAAAALIASHRIAILVELNGWTSHMRFGILASRPGMWFDRLLDRMPWPPRD